MCPPDLALDDVRAQPSALLVCDPACLIAGSSVYYALCALQFAAHLHSGCTAYGSFLLQGVLCRLKLCCI